MLDVQKSLPDARYRRQKQLRLRWAQNVRERGEGGRHLNDTVFATVEKNILS